MLNDEVQDNWLLAMPKRASATSLRHKLGASEGRGLVGGTPGSTYLQHGEAGLQVGDTQSKEQEAVELSSGLLDEESRSRFWH